MLLLVLFSPWVLVLACGEVVEELPISLYLGSVHTCIVLLVSKWVLGHCPGLSLVA